MNVQPAHIKEKIEKIRAFVTDHQETLHHLVANLPDDGSLLPLPIAAALGKCEIWPRRDGALVLTYDDNSSVTVREYEDKSLSEFLKEGQPVAYFDEKEAPVPVRIMYQPNSTGVPLEIKLPPDDFSFSSFSNDNLIIWWPEETPEMLDLGRTFFRPRFKRLSLYGWNTWLGNPKERAFKDFREGFMFENLLKPSHRQSVTNRGEVILGAAERLALDFEAVLADANDDHIRRFVIEHPEIIQPDYIRAYPGTPPDSQSDLVLLTPGDNGLQWKLMKLGNSTDALFSETSQVSEAFSTAKAELASCVGHGSKVLQDIPIQIPDGNISYQSVLSRNTTLSYPQRKQLLAQNTESDLMFITYDDLVNKLRFQVSDVVEIRERYLPVNTRLERLNIRSDEDFNQVMEIIDQEMRDEEIPATARDMEGWFRFSSTYGLNLMGRDPLSIKIYGWFKTRYGDKLNIDTDVGAMGVILRGDIFRMRFPLGYGLNRVICLKELTKERQQIITGTRDNPPTLNVLDFVEGLTQDYANSLTKEELEGLFNQFVFGRTAFMRIYEASQSEGLRSQARADLNASTNHLFTHPPSYGLSKWASLQAAEKFIKAFISAKGGEIPRSHRLQELSNIAETLGMSKIPEQWLSDIQCSAEVRYGGIIVTVQEAVEAQYSALQVCEHIANQLTN